MKRLSEYREVALRFRALADYGTEGELRAELKRLSAEMATWIIATEIKAMTVEESATDIKGEPDRPPRWRWRRFWHAWGSKSRSYAAPA